MLRLTQIIRNLYLRLEGWLGVVFKNVLGVIRNVLGFFARLFGFTKAEYFLESDESTGINRNTAKEPKESEQNKTPETPTPNRRRPQGKMDDYYLNMARDVKKS
jgi:hypothetical protein